MTNSLIEEHLKTIEHANVQERAALNAKLKGYERLKNRLKLSYEKELDAVDVVKDWSYKIITRRESTSIDLVLHIKPEDHYVKDLEQCSAETGFAIKEEIREKVFDMIVEEGIEDFLDIRVVYGREWMRVTDN